MQLFVIALITIFFMFSCSTIHKDNKATKQQILEGKKNVKQAPVLPIIEGELNSLVGKEYFALSPIKNMPVGTKMKFESYRIERLDYYPEYSYGEIVFIFKSKDSNYITDRIHIREKTGFSELMFKQYASKKDPFIKFYRKGLNRYIKLARDRKIALKMPEELLILSFGYPKKINSTTGFYGVHKQYVYKNIYVYVDNGVVTSWQNW